MKRTFEFTIMEMLKTSLNIFGLLGIMIASVSFKNINSEKSSLNRVAKSLFVYSEFSNNTLCQILEKDMNLIAFLNDGMILIYDSKYDLFSKPKKCKPIS